MTRYVCIHGHFYQPPRENPWLEAIEHQVSAHPYHDWNERVNAECYAPNRAARILDSNGLITKIVNNYARMSFNFGPTLLSWMEATDTKTYKSILSAHEESRRHFSGHGSALAQAYNHIIMPLANRRDKYTQVLWGNRDFEHRFGKAPEGMWLPETAVDLESLDIMAELGIRFTILAPHQAKRIRKSGDHAWKDVDERSLDTTTPYTVQLPSGRTISVFFYNGPISRAIAFEKLLVSGEAFQESLLGAFSGTRDAQLVHIATDGETYGHHHKYGDMALAYVLEYMGRNGAATLTNYGEYLEKHPPAHEAEIRENTSWSCAHGIERWRSDCGCHTGVHPGWNQKWRKPLRDALNWLRDSLIPLYEQECRRLIRDPWAARNAYVSVILDRSPAKVEQFLAAHCIHPPGDSDRVRVLKLMELQRNALLMFTSCGWFFDDVSGVEPSQILQYAGRCLQFARELTRADLEQTFLRKLESAASNIPDKVNGRRVYEQTVKASSLDDVARHAVVRAVYLPNLQDMPYSCYDVTFGCQERLGNAEQSLIAGQLSVKSRLTFEQGDFFFGARPDFSPEIDCGVRRAALDERGEEFIAEAKRIWQEAEKQSGAVERLFPEGRTSLDTLLRDDRRSLLLSFARHAVDEAAESYRRSYRDHASLWKAMRKDGAILPYETTLAAQSAVLAEIRNVLGTDIADTKHIRELIEDASSWGVEGASEEISNLFRDRIMEAIDGWRASPSDLSLLHSLRTLIELGRDEFFEASLWDAQNVFYDVACEIEAAPSAAHAQRGSKSDEWRRAFAELGESLGVKVD